MARQKDRLLGGERNEGAQIEECDGEGEEATSRTRNVASASMLKSKILSTGNEKRSWNTPGCIYKNVIFSR